MINRTHFRFNATSKVFPITSKVSCYMVTPGAVNPVQNTYVEAHEHEVKLEIVSRFRCPNGTYEVARNEAERSLIRMIFNDVLVALTDIRQAAYSGDSRLILDACNKLETEIMN